MGASFYRIAGDVMLTEWKRKKPPVSVKGNEELGFDSREGA